MTTKIRVLSEQTINQIAAGEVIESPASVVKELVENSFDAQAKHIIIEIVAGGFSLIKISDDGEGMTHDDALLSIERHATSKIRSAEDLFSIMTMGFRGEALASIASIAKMHLVTRHAKETVGTHLYVEGGKCLKIELAPRTQGTTFEIRSLFYTTPARKKFQKNPSQAAADVHKVLTHLALSSPDRAFTFISNDETIFKLYSESFEQRIENLLGLSLKQDMKSFHTCFDWIEIKGMLSLPGVDRPNRLGQYVFVNKRAVVAPQVSYAIQEAYGTMLTPRRFPVFVLDITLRADLIDVNVHPQKKEIRFKEEQLLKELLRNEVNKHLNVTAFETVPPESLLNQEFKPLQEKRPIFDFKTLSCFDVKESIQSKTDEPLLLVAPTPTQQLADLKIIGVFKHYLLIEAASCNRLFDCDYLHSPKEGFIMVDLAGMSRRMYYEKALMTQESKGCLEQLLFPIKMEFSSKEAATLEQQLELLETIGIHISLFGNNVFILQACDKSFDEEHIQHFLRELLDEDRLCGISLQAKKERLALKACKYLALENKVYDQETAKMILGQFLKEKHLFYTPDGKKIICWIREGIYAKGF